MRPARPSLWDRAIKTRPKKSSAEGIVATEVAYKVGKKLNIDLPITNAIYSVLYENAKPEETVRTLMTRSKKNEMEEVVNNGFVHN